MGANFRYFGRLVICPAVLALAQMAFAGQITITGTITQSVPDGTGPAVNNPALNSIFDGDAFEITLGFAGSSLAAGTTEVTSLEFSDLTAGVSETGFGPFQCSAGNTTACLTVTPDGSFLDFSVLGCLTAGSGCAAGNQLDSDFEIPAAGAEMPGVSATVLDQPHPMDLLEDDGTTDIQGSITQYSFGAAEPAAPEPRSSFLLGGGLVVFFVRKQFRSREKHS